MSETSQAVRELRREYHKVFPRWKECSEAVIAELEAANRHNARFKAALQRIVDESPSGLACSEIAVESLFLSATLKAHEPNQNR